MFKIFLKNSSSNGDALWIGPAAVAGLNCNFPVVLFIFRILTIVANTNISEYEQRSESLTYKNLYVTNIFVAKIYVT